MTGLAKVDLPQSAAYRAAGEGLDAAAAEAASLADDLDDALERAGRALALAGELRRGLAGWRSYDGFSGQRCLLRDKS